MRGDCGQPSWPVWHRSSRTHAPLFTIMQNVDSLSERDMDLPREALAGAACHSHSGLLLGLSCLSLVVGNGC